MRLLLALVFLAGGLAAARWSMPSSESPDPPAVVGNETPPPRGLFPRFHEGHTWNQERSSALQRATSHVHEAASAAQAWLLAPSDAEALDRSAEHLREGRIERSRGESARVLATTDDARIGARARILLGVAAHRRGDCAGALTAWGDLSSDAWSDASNPLQPALPWLQLLAAECEREAGEPTRAVELADASLDGLGRSVSWHHARLEAARARLRVPTLRVEGLARAARLLEIYPELPLAHVLQLEMVEAQIAEGRLREAHALLEPWRFAWPDHALAPRGAALAAQLEAEGFRPPARSWRDVRDAARSLRWERRWAAAETFFAEAESRATRAGVARSDLHDLWFDRARNAWESARFHDCIEWLDRIEADERPAIDERERVRWRIRCISRVGRVDEAWDLATRYYATRSRTDAQRALLEYAMDFGRWDDARRIRREMGAAERDFEGAFLAYMARDLSTAERLFGELADRSRGSTRARYAYWLGRTHARQGRVDEALDAWQRASDASPHSYYAMQAANRTIEWLEAEPPSPVRPLERPGRIHWEGIHGPPSATLQDLERAQPEIDFFATWQEAAPADDALDTFADSWGGLFPEAIAARALFSVGLGEEARRTLRDAALEFRTLDALFERGREVSTRRPIRLDRRLWEHEIDNRPSPRGYWGITLAEPRWPVPEGRRQLEAHVGRHRAIRDARGAIGEDLLAALARVGDPWAVRRSVFRRGSLHGRPMEGETRRDWLMAYPLAYGRLLEPHARAMDQNPLLLLGLMIVESDMNPDSISRADAYGLLQVIPRTGQLIALARGDAEFGIHSLLDPASSISYGMWYLHELLRKFHGQEVLALVAYNAGPHQVQRWLEWRGEGMDLDEFLETVPFNGARTYPMRVFQHLSTYRGIHAASRAVYVGNRLETATRDNIYF